MTADGKAAMSVSARRPLAERYELGELLGSGGMADVHRAWDTRLRRQVAVKLFRPGADARRFDSEARTLASLSHPGLVQVHDAGTADGTPFVVLELVRGPTLRDRVESGPLRVEEVRRLGAQLADALAYVHGRGVVHRDVKPSNILLGDQARLADFGLARLVDSTHLTEAGQLVGTAAYLAPEQVRGEETGLAADVYALGLVLLECLTGQREYQGSDIEAAVARLHRSPVVPDELPADLRHLLTLMTSLSPRRRPTAAQCAHALRHPGQTLVGPSVPVRPPVRMLAASAVLVLLTVAGVATALIDPPPPAESAPPAVSSTAPPVTTTPVTPAATPQPDAPVLVDDDMTDTSGKKKGSGKGKGNSGKG